MMSCACKAQRHQSKNQCSLVKNTKLSPKQLPGRSKESQRQQKDTLTQQMLLHQIGIMHYAVLSRHKKRGCKQQAHKQADNADRARVASILLLPSSFLAQVKTTPKFAAAGSHPLSADC